MSANNSNGLTVRTITGTTGTVQATDDVIVFTGTGAKTVSIPAAASAQRGKVYVFSNQNTGALTISSTGQIDGQSTRVIPAAAGTPLVPATASLVFDGTNWFTA